MPDLRDLRARLDPRWWGAQDWFFALMVVAVVTAPVLALVEAWSEGWLPQGDDATIGVRTAGILDGSLPITGMRSTSGATDPLLSAHHLGPVEFYLLSLPLALSGGHAIGIALGCTALAGIAAVWSLVWARRLGSLLGVLVFGVAIIIGQWAVGSQLLYRPLNPFFGTLTIFLALILAVAILRGHHRAWPGFVFATAVSAQANLAFLPLVVSVVAFVVLSRAAHVVRERRRGAAMPPDARVSARWTLALAGLLWLPSLVELVVRQPNNLQILTAWATSGSGSSTGLSAALQQLSLLAPFPGGFRGYSLDLLGPGSAVAAVVGGAVVLALAAIVVTGKKVPGRATARVPATVALVANLGMLATAAAMPEYPAAPYWLVHWIPLVPFTWAALVWGATAHVRGLSPRLSTWPVVHVAAAVAVASLGLHTVLARPPLEDGTTNARAAQLISEHLGEGDGRSVRIHGLGFVPLLGTAPAMAFELDRRGWEPHYLLPWPYPEDTEHLWLDSDPNPDVKIVILDTEEPDFAADLSPGAEKVGVVEMPDPGRLLAVYQVPLDTP